MPHRSVLSYNEARQALKARAGPHAWRDVAESFSGEVWPEVSPSFKVRPGDVVFTMGSCFARNIETHLALLGCRVPMMDFDLPPSEWSGGVHGAMNRFHPPAFRQTLEWTARIHDRDGVVGWDDCADFAFDFGAGLYFDLDMGAASPVTQARFIERRQHVFDIFRTVFSAACLMMTPGLIEAWRDRTTGLYVHNAPKLKPLLGDPDRWQLEVLSYDACHRDMLAAIDVVRARNPDVKVLLTTSPVPLTSTFTGQDVRIANTYSKSVLRAVCGAATFERPDVDYFPSFESVTLSFPKGVWKDDRLHVAHGFIAKIVTRMLDRYLDGVDDADRHCHRARMHLLSGKAAAGEQSARAALEANPAHVEARVLLADALTRQDRGAEAEAQLSEVLALHPERPDLWLARARAVGRATGERALLATGCIETAVALPGVGLQDLRTVSALVRKSPDPVAAERIARRMIELYPLHVESYQTLIDVLIDQRRWPEAIERLQHAVKLRRTPMEMYFQLASLLRKVGRPQEALPHLETVLLMDPDHETAKALRLRLTALQPEAA